MKRVIHSNLTPVAVVELGDVIELDGTPHEFIQIDTDGTISLMEVGGNPEHHRCFFAPDLPEGIEFVECVLDEVYVYGAYYEHSDNFEYGIQRFKPCGDHQFIVEHRKEVIRVPDHNAVFLALQGIEVAEQLHKAELQERLVDLGKAKDRLKSIGYTPTELAEGVLV